MFMLRSLCTAAASLVANVAIAQETPPPSATWRSAISEEDWGSTCTTSVTVGPVTIGFLAAPGGALIAFIEGSALPSPLITSWAIDGSTVATLDGALDDYFGWHTFESVPTNLMELVAQGRLLELDASSQTYSFPLTGSAAAIAEFKSCYQAAPPTNLTIPTGSDPTAAVTLLETAVSCSTAEFDPQAILSVLRSERIIQKKPAEQVDGIPNFLTDKVLYLFGYSVIAVQGWNYEGSLFSRGPGTAPPVHVGATVEGSVAEVTAHLADIGLPVGAWSSGRPHLYVTEGDFYTEVGLAFEGKDLSTIICSMS